VVNAELAEFAELADAELADAELAELAEPLLFVFVL